MPDHTSNIVVFASGGGSNFQAIHDACVNGTIPGRIVLVVTTNAQAGIIKRAHSAGIPTVICGTSDDPLHLLEGYEVDLIALAGYMRLVPAHVVEAFAGRMLNVHPSLLPAFGGQGMYGMHVHKAVVDRGVKITGATIHLVDSAYDNGPIVLQEAIRIDECDTPEQVAARVLQIEHSIYPEAVRLLAEGRLKLDGRRVHILPKPTVS